MKTHCKRGHALIGDNVRVRTQHGGYIQRNCRKCEAFHQGRRDKAKVGRVEIYEPLDVILESPTVRVLRAIRRYDWMTMADIAEILDVRDVQSRNNLSGTIQNAARQGYIEKSSGSGLRLYRITTSGIGRLDRVMNRYVEALDCIELSDDELTEAA